MKSKIPKWLNTLKLKEASNDQVKENLQLRFNFPIKSHDVITSYKCGSCKLQFTHRDVEPQIKKAARTGSLYIECPKCGGVIEAGKVVNVPDSQSIIQRAVKMTDSNTPPSRSINTWIDKAIYGRLVDHLGRYIEKFGIFNPQLKFQRGIRSEKFPGEPLSAKGAEFTVEFIDNNNTRNRIVIQAGLSPKGEFIWPRTFKTLSGNEYPLTKLAIENFTSGKLYSPATPSYAVPPLNYKQRDITDFRVISADNKKIVKKAVLDDQQLNDIVNQMNITDPTDQQAMKNLLGKYYDPNNPQQFNVGLGTQNLGQAVASTEPKLSLKKTGIDINWFTTAAVPEVEKLVNQGLGYDDAYDEAYRIFQEKFGVTITTSDWNLLWNAAINTLNQGDIQPSTAQLAEKLIKQAESISVKSLYKTAEDVIKEFNLSDLSTDESKEWTDSYIETYNKTLDTGEGIVEASRKAEVTADEKLASSRIKLSLRDKQTLVPYVEKDPDYSIAEQTQFSEKRFDVPYNETDAGISDEEDRNYTTMFKGSSIQKEAYIRHVDGQWIVYSEAGKILGKHKTKEEAQKQLQAVEISKHKKGSVGIAGGYTLTPAGDRNLELLSRGLPVGNYDQASLIAILGWVKGHPYEPIENIEGIAIENGMDIDTLRNTFTAAVTDEMINVPTMSSTNKMEKEGEATGVDLDPEEVGQNPINYSRLKQIVEDLLRAGNIPPTKVDLHALKDGKYSLKELQDLVDTFKVKEDTFYPTTHASFNKDEIIKLAETKISDMIKEMPLEKIPNTEVGKEEKAFEGSAKETDTEEAVEKLISEEHAHEAEYHELSENPKLSDKDKQVAKEMGEYACDQAESMEGVRDNLATETKKEAGLSMKDLKPESKEEKDAKFDPEQLAKGTKVEMEHTSNKEVAEKIAKDHLMEIPDYYTRLEQMKGKAATSTFDLQEKLLKSALKTVEDNPENFRKGIKKSAELLDPFGKPLRSEEPKEEVPEAPVEEGPKSEFQKEPSWRQRSVDVKTLPPESREATPEEKELFSQLTINKLELEKADTEIALLRQVLSERQKKESEEYEKGVISPMTGRRKELYNKMLEATDKLAGLLRESQNRYIDIDNRYKAFLTQRTTSTTVPVNWRVVVEKIKEKAPELQALIDEIVNGIKSINKTEKQIEQLEFWPASTKKSADESAVVNYLATLYQNVYNNLSDLLKVLTDVDQTLAAL